jgi:hypothetical protein
MTNKFNGPSRNGYALGVLFRIPLRALVSLV